LIASLCNLVAVPEASLPTSNDPALFRQALDGATDFVDFLNRLLELGYRDTQLMEIFMAERHGDGWVPEHTHPD